MDGCIVTRPSELELPRIWRQADLPALRKHCGGQEIALASGCFDLIHKGHLHFLKEAARQGDVLVVGVNSDESVRLLKGRSRPIICGRDRCAVLSEFACVNYVFEYGELCAGVSIHLLRPDVFVVGSDSVCRFPDEIDAARVVGARVHEITKIGLTSTTTIIDAVTQRGVD